MFLAAKLTLRMHVEAVAEGWDLKDASAWNVVFDGLRPVFVDLLSFEHLRERVWRASGQYARHFLLPLFLEKKQKLKAHQCFQLWRDGAPPEQAAAILGPFRFLTRYWPLTTRGKDLAAPVSCNSKDSELSSLPIAALQRYRQNLNTGLDWMLNGLNPDCWSNRSSVWGQYEHERKHYETEALDNKRRAIRKWLNQIQPMWTLDIGCNSGEFSAMGAEVGARVICLDGDSLALNNLCQRHAKSPYSRHLYPVLGQIDDAYGGRGWLGAEFSSLTSRLEKRVDVVMLLAVAHHLAIAGSISLRDVFGMVRAYSKCWAIVELLSELDPRVVQLCQHFGRTPKEFSLDQQFDALRSAGFDVVEVASDSSNTRPLVLLKINQVQEVAPSN